MTLVFCDTSSLILLEKAGMFPDVAAHLDLCISPSVLDEITATDTSDACMFAGLAEKGGIRVAGLPEHPIDPGSSPGLDRLDTGEKDTIGLYLDQQQGFILVDDGPAAKWCLSNSLPFINALLVPKIFWYAGIMSRSACMNKMNRLCRLGWYSQKVRTIAFEYRRKDLAFFVDRVKR